jgi:hypothetical protein
MKLHLKDMECDNVDCCHVILGRDSSAVFAGMVYMKGGKFIDFLSNFSFSNNFCSMDRIYLFLYLVRGPYAATEVDLQINLYLKLIMV